MQPTSNPWHYLPEDSFYNILSYCLVPEAIRSSLVSNQWNQRIKKAPTEFWRSLGNRYLPNLPSETPDWKEIVIRSHKKHYAIFDSTVYKQWTSKSLPSNNGGFLSLFSKKKTLAHALLIGPRGSGKSSILQKLKTGDSKVKDDLSSSARVETIEYKDTAFRIMDISGADFYSGLKQYAKCLESEPIIIFCVDSNNFLPEDIENYQTIMTLARSHEKKQSFFLYLANKQDYVGTKTLAEITDKLGLHCLRNVNWYIQAVCALSGDGLYEGLDWLNSSIKDRNK